MCEREEGEDEAEEVNGRHSLLIDIGIDYLLFTCLSSHIVRVAVYCVAPSFLTQHSMVKGLYCSSFSGLPIAYKNN